MNTRVLLSAICSFAITGVSAQAATFTTGAFGVGSDLTIVEADPFASDGTEGNTGRADGSGTFWSNADNNGSDGLWRERTISPFVTGYESLAGATDRTFELQDLDMDTFNGGGPALRTTVSGLAAENYEVFLVYLIRNDGIIDDAGTLAELNSAVSASSIFYDVSNGTSLNDDGANWSVAVASLGTTGDGASGFFVEAAGEAGHNRIQHIGVAYRVVPEPGSLALLGLGGLALLRRRRA